MEQTSSMDAFEIKGKPAHEKKLIQLETLLNIEIPVSGTLILMWWLLPGEVIFLIFAAAIILLPIFTIALAVLLFQLRKIGWFSVLILFVVVPFCVIPFVYSNSVMYPAHFIVPLAIFAFYSLFLRLFLPYWPD